VALVTRFNGRRGVVCRADQSLSGHVDVFRRWRAAIVLALCCGAAVSGLFAQETSHKSEKPKQLNPSSSQAGRQTFESICASCHGLDGRGGERGPDIATRAEVVRLSDERLSSILRTGIPQSGMPAFAALGSTKLSATVRHLRVLQGKGATPALPGNPEKGKEIFAGKAGCSECHMVRGLGGFLGPDLSNYGATHSAGDVRSAVVSVDKRSRLHKMLAKVTTKDGKTVSGLVRNEDNFSLQLQAPDGAFHLLMKSDIADVTYDSKPLMPADYATKLSENELNHLVAYLAIVAQAGHEKETATRKANGKISNED
jgi:cytochrome c oxidase cbb3-type subunit III